MSLKKWIYIFILFMIMTGGIVGAFNVAVDPFGVFEDKLLNWYAYDMTNNPRVSKIAYLDKHFKEYDSYIIGCSKTSSLPTEVLNKYYNGAKFYNMIMYGGDMYDIDCTALYIINNYKVKNIIINVGLEEADAYNKEKDQLKNDLHAKVTNSPLFPFYAKYFFENPEYSYLKLVEYFSKSYLPNKYWVFTPQTGTYNKILRDSEAIGNMDEYIDKNPEFKVELSAKKAMAIDNSVATIAKIKKLCDEKGITFKLITSPVYYKEVAEYNPQELISYWTKIANATDFWDFSGYSPISFEPRYFYDLLHFRNAVGNMMSAYIFNDKSIYIPEGFGHYTTKGNVQKQAQIIFNNDRSHPNAENYTKKVPILMYHNLDTDINKTGAETVTPGKFKADLQILKKNGFSTIDFKDIVDYVTKGKEIPQKSIIITFDDGYISNYLYAYPILKDMGMKATISVIGMSVGKDKYKDTNYDIIPHFDYNAAKTMYLSGFIDIQSHSFAMHDAEKLDNDYRNGVLPKKNEKESDYIKVFTSDYIRSRNDIEKNVGNNVFVYAYPQGESTVLTEALLVELGAEVTLTTNPGINTIVKGLPQSLYTLKRINVPQSLTGEELMANINELIKNN